MMDTNSSLQKRKYMLNLGRNIGRQVKTFYYSLLKHKTYMENLNTALSVHVIHYFLILNTINTPSVLFSVRTSNDMKGKARGQTFQ